MKFLHIINSAKAESGGPIEGVRQLARSLFSRGIRVDILCCDSPEEKAKFPEINEIFRLGPGFLKYGISLKLQPWLRENAEKYDAVFINGLWQFHGFAAWQTLTKLGIPYFVFSHGMLDPWFKHRYPIKHIKKWLYWPWAEYRVLRDARAVVFTCEEERLLARKSFWLYRANEVVTAYGTEGTPPRRAELIQSFFEHYPSLAKKRIILFVGRLHEKKGL